MLDSLMENKLGKELKKKFFQKETVKVLEDSIKKEYARKETIQAAPPQGTKIDSKKKAMDVLENVIKKPVYDLLDCENVNKEPFVIMLGTNKAVDAILRTPPEMLGIAVGAGLMSYIGNKSIKKAMKTTGMMVAESIVVSNMTRAYAHYSRISNTLVIPFADDVRFTCTMAHEYIHAIQGDKKNDMTKWSKLIGEGHAEAAALDATETMGKDLNDIRYINYSRHTKKSRLLIAYYDLCKKVGEEPKLITQANKTKLPKSTVYDSGVAIFEMAKNKHDKSVYSKVLKGDYSVLGL